MLVALQSSSLAIFFKLKDEYFLIAVQPPFSTFLQNSQWFTVMGPQISQSPEVNLLRPLALQQKFKRLLKAKINSLI